MNIAYLISEYPSRSHTFIRREIYALRERGLSIHTYSIRKQAKKELICNQDWIDYNDTQSILPINPIQIIKSHLFLFTKKPFRYISTLVKAIQHRLPGSKNLLWSIFHFNEAIRLADMLNNKKIDHIHVHFANAGATIGYLTHNYTNISWSVTLHGACDFEYPAAPLLGNKILSTDFTVCVSSYGKSQAFRVIPTSCWDKIIVSRCGIEPIEITHVHRPSTGKKLLCIARLSNEKGIEGLLIAFSLLQNDHPSSELTIIGDGPERQHIEDRIKQDKLNNITLVGSVAERDVFHYIDKADIIVLSSLMEGIPLVLMESMAAKKPVIAPRIAGIPELVLDEINGLLFTPGEWHELSEKIDRLINNQELRLLLGESAKNTIDREYTINSSIDPLFKKFKSLK